VILALAAAACGPKRPVEPPRLPTPGTPASPAAEPETVSWQEWGVNAFNHAREQHRPVLVILARRHVLRDREVWADVTATPPLVEGWARQAVLVRADPDEVPELGDFTETAATVFQQQRAYPMAILLTPEAVPLGVVGDGFFHTGIDALLAAKGALPAVRLVDDPNLQAIRRAQRPTKATRPLTRDRAEARAGVLSKSGGRAAAGSLLLILEARERLHVAAPGQAASRALAAAQPTDRLDDVAFRLWLHARLAEGALDGDGTRAQQLLEATDAYRAGDTGLFQIGAGADPDVRIFTASNGAMMAALATAGARLFGPAATVRATRAAESLLARLGPATALRRGDEAGRSLGPARLDDYAWLGLGLLAVHEATSDRRWLSEAEKVADAAVAHFWDSAEGGFYLNAEPTAPLTVRIKSGFDSEHPSANALMALFLDELGERTGRAQLRALARRTVEAFAGDLERAPAGMDGLLAAALRVLPPAPAVTTSTTATTGPTTAPATPVTAPVVPSRVVRGAVTLEARAERDTLRRGERSQITIEITIAEGWSVTSHRPAERAAVPLSVTLLEPDMGAGPAVFPSAADRQMTAAVPLRVPADADLGRRPVRVAVRYEACPASGACAPAERVTLGVPLTIAP
jgi:hypothetical protein